MKNKIYLLFAILFFIAFVNANLGTFKQGDCVMIRVLANCSIVNITEVSNNNQTFIINSPMTNLGGQTFNYSFCNTTIIDKYTYSWNNPCVDCSSGDCGNSFEITSSGYIASTPQTLSMFLIIGIFMFVIVLFFIFGIRTEYLPAKLFCLSFSVILIVFLIGYIMSVANITLGEFTNLTNGFTPLYIIFISLLTVGGIGIVVYLIYVSFTAFYKFRGLRE